MLDGVFEAAEEVRQAGAVRPGRGVRPAAAAQVLAVQDFNKSREIIIDLEVVRK